jgi:predicted PurR-regulated permease PerM
MLGYDSKAARCTWTALIVLLLVYVVYLVRATLFIFVLALLFAHLLSPLVDLIDRFLPGRRTRTRTPALAVVYIVLVAVVVLLAVQFGSVAVEQAKALAVSFPPMIKNAVTGWQNSSTGIDSLNALKQQAMEGFQTKLADLASALPETSMKIVSAVGNLIYVVIIPILAFLFLKDAETLKKSLLELAGDGPRRAVIEDVIADIHVLLAHYIRALVALAFAAFAAYGIFFAILGVPYGVLLAAMGGILEFIPMIGPVVSVVIITLVAGITTGHWIAIVIFLIAFRMLQDYIISPHLMERGVAIHPLLVLFGVFAGAEIAGIPGTFLSVPVLAMVRIVYVRVRKAMQPQIATSGDAGT